MPVLLLLFVALLAAGALLFQYGRATGLAAEARSGSDAAALAAVKNMRTQMEALASEFGFADVAMLDAASACDAAADYASANGSEVLDCEVDPLALEAQVTVQTTEALGDDAKSVDSEEARGQETSRAKLNVSFSLGGNIPNLGASSASQGFIEGSEWKEFKGEVAGTRDIVALGRFLASHSYAVGEHPLFGGVCDGCHTEGSWHYRNGAIDVNADGAPGGEMAALDRIAGSIQTAGYNVVWRVEDHFDHLHADIGAAGPDQGVPGVFGLATYEIVLIEAQE